MYGRENTFLLLQQWDCLAAMVRVYLQDCLSDTEHTYGWTSFENARLHL